ncbi:UV-endonuclease UvdE-domain-containing protein [Nemania sp. NC0429]|nr:UV-endonuclease UvdE-domain-containing protein [Nemania sp. NC0429]
MPDLSPNDINLDNRNTVSRDQPQKQPNALARSAAAVFRRAKSQTRLLPSTLLLWSGISMRSLRRRRRRNGPRSQIRRWGAPITHPSARDTQDALNQLYKVTRKIGQSSYQPDDDTECPICLASFSRRSEDGERRPHAEVDLEAGLGAPDIAGASAPTKKKEKKGSIPAIVSKRKKSATALMAPEPTVNEHASRGGLRRSGRLSGREGRALTLKPTEDRKLDMPTVQSQKQKHGELEWLPDIGGLEVTRNGLQEMEDQFRNAVKRQKKAVEEGQVALEEPEEQTAFIQLKRGYGTFMPNLICALPNVLPVNKQINELKKDTVRRLQAASQSRLEDEEDREVMGREDTDTAFNDENGTNAMNSGARPPPACLNTYLRNSNPSVFSSRTCRIASILEHRHPLRDPSQPEHPTKNRPDLEQPADIGRGQKFVEALGLANARDIVKMLRWNDKYGIKFMRLSSEMFPFASHEVYGYKLAPFSSETLADAGRVAGQLGHRLTTHPGQFTQLGSPRDEVVRNAVRDLEYHDEMLSLLRLPKQQDKDAVMIIHMGGVFGDKAATLDRFRANYRNLSEGIKARLVLENDDVSWTVHNLLPICEELNIPFVLDFHHHNIMFDKGMIREGTNDIIELYPRIKATWDRKGITQKMHYSEPCPEAVTPRQRRKHRPRVMTLPPCPDTMDLMIEAKDKEQAVFDLMRTFRLPGWDTFNDVIPYEREDENRPLPKVPKKKKPGKKKGKNDDDAGDDDVVDDEPKIPREVPEAELGMGGPDNRVYWPLGMEEWLRPRKREAKTKKKRKLDDEIDDEDGGEEEAD